MKLSTILLLTVLIIVTFSLFASNYILKLEYNKIDRTDPFWNYSTISEKPFKHLVIKGGYRGNMLFEPSEKNSVKMSQWKLKDFKNISTNISNDTLYINFPTDFLKEYTKNFYSPFTYEILIISAPEILSINGTDAKLTCKKMKQENYLINLNGKSSVELESSTNKIHQLDIVANDSSSFHYLAQKLEIAHY
jgi:hypothetical protein